MVNEMFFHTFHIKRLDIFHLNVKFCLGEYVHLIQSKGYRFPPPSSHQIAADDLYFRGLVGQPQLVRLRGRYSTQMTSDWGLWGCAQSSTKLPLIEFSSMIWFCSDWCHATICCFLTRSVSSCIILCNLYEIFLDKLCKEQMQLMVRDVGPWIRIPETLHELYAHLSQFIGKFWSIICHLYFSPCYDRGKWKKRVKEVVRGEFGGSS